MSGKFTLGRCLLIAIPLAVLLLGAATVSLLARGQDLKSRSALISVGMSREQLEGLLGPPGFINITPMMAERSIGLVWTDQLWRVEVLTGPDGRAKSVSCIPSNSLLRRTVGRFISLPK